MKLQWYLKVDHYKPPEIVTEKIPVDLLRTFGPFPSWAKARDQAIHWYKEEIESNQLYLRQTKKLVNPEWSHRGK